MERMKEFLRSAKAGRESWSKSGASSGKSSVSSRERNSGEEKRAEELEKRPTADILVCSGFIENINHTHEMEGTTILVSVFSKLTQVPPDPKKVQQISLKAGARIRLETGESAWRHPGLD